MSPHMYRNILTGTWDHQYLRACAVYRLMKRGVIGKARAIELLAERRTPNPKAVVELLSPNPFRHLSGLA